MANSPCSISNLCDVVETFLDQHHVQSLFSYIEAINRSDPITTTNKSNAAIFEYEPNVWEKHMENEQASFEELFMKIINEMIGNLFRDKDNISFKKTINQELHSVSIINRVEYLMKILDKLIEMIKGDRVMLNDLEEVVQRKKIVSFWISMANAILILLFYIYLTFRMENVETVVDWKLFRTKMEKQYLLYSLYQYLKMDFYQNACMSRKFEEINIDLSKIYYLLDAIKLDISKDNQLPDLDMLPFQYLIHLFVKYFVGRSEKPGYVKLCVNGSIYIYEIVMNYLISINNSELQPRYASKVSEVFEKKVKITAFNYCSLDKKLNLFILQHSLASTFVSVLKTHNSTLFYSLYNEMDYLTERAFNKEEYTIKTQENGSEDIELFKELLTCVFDSEFSFRPKRNKGIFFAKTDEYILFNSKHNIKRNIMESIVFKVLFLVSNGNLGMTITNKLLPKMNKLELFTKCCMECYFEEPKIIDTSSSFLVVIYSILRNQLSQHKGIRENIGKAFRGCTNMINAGKQCVVLYYPNYHTDEHYLNSKILLESILHNFTHNLSQVYPIEFRIVLNQVVCSLMDNGQKQDQAYISLFNSDLRNSMFSTFDHFRQVIKDPFLYKYLCTFSPISTHYVDIFEKFNQPKHLEKTMEELYPRLCFRNLIFVDANQNHRPFLPLTACSNMEDLTHTQLVKKYRSFIQFSLYSHISHLVDTIIICLE